MAPCEGHRRRGKCRLGPPRQLRRRQPQLQRQPGAERPAQAAQEETEGKHCLGQALLLKMRWMSAGLAVVACLVSPGWRCSPELGRVRNLAVKWAVLALPLRQLQGAGVAMRGDEAGL